MKYSYLPLDYTTVILHFMSGHRLTQFKYALWMKVEPFGNLIYTVKEETITHISQANLLHTHYNSIYYPVVWFMSARLRPIMSLSKEHLFHTEENLMNRTDTTTPQRECRQFQHKGGIKLLLLIKVKMFSLRIR